MEVTYEDPWYRPNARDDLIMLLTRNMLTSALVDLCRLTMSLRSCSTEQTESMQLPLFNSVFETMPPAFTNRCCADRHIIDVCFLFDIVRGSIAYATPDIFPMSSFFLDHEAALKQIGPSVWYTNERMGPIAV